MPQLRRRRAGAKITSGGILHLACGQDFFGDGFGADVETMREVWRDSTVQDRVRQRTREKWGPDVVPFAELLFGADGTKPALVSEVAAARDAYRRQRDAAVRQP